jgi:hypothetical protein
LIARTKMKFLRADWGSLSRTEKEKEEEVRTGG